MAKFIVSRTVTQDVLVENVKDEKEAAELVHIIMENVEDAYPSIRVIEETVVSVDVLPFASGNLAKRVHKLAEGASEDRFTQLSEHEIRQ